MTQPLIQKARWDAKDNTRTKFALILLAGTLDGLIFFLTLGKYVGYFRYPLLFAEDWKEVCTEYRKAWRA